VLGPPEGPALPALPAGGAEAPALAMTAEASAGEMVRVLVEVLTDADAPELSFELPLEEPVLSPELPLEEPVLSPELPLEEPLELPVLPLELEELEEPLEELPEAPPRAS